MENVIRTTTDYSIFKSLEGNRPVNLLHAKRIENSMREKCVFTVIIVNENYEIVDGQHRFNALKNLGLPVNYVVQSGYGIEDVQKLNQNSKTWKSKDFIEGYCLVGNINYMILKDFVNKYGFGIAESITMLQSKPANTDNNKTRDLYNGKFQVTSYDEAIDLAEKITKISSYYSGYKRRSFVYAMISLLRSGVFNIDEFIDKLKLQRTALVDCPTAKIYIELIEKIYNYKRRDKINLRY